MSTRKTRTGPLRIEKSADAMGSTFSIVLYGDDWGTMESAVDAAFGEVGRLDEMLSNYRPESEWSEVNRHAARRPVRLTPESFGLLSCCLEYSRQSDGAFDVSVGPLMRAWGFFKGTGKMPSKTAVEAAREAVGYRHICLDPVERTVRFDGAGVEIDPGGIGKGYAVDRIVDVLRRRGFDTALVAASGSSIYGLGTPPGDPEGWPVDIRDPRDARKSAAETRLRDMSMSTSGILEKSFRAGGRHYCHIVDPRTGYPVQGSLLVSVIAPRTLDSEAWAKPYFINGRQWAARHKPEEFHIFFREDGTESTGFWL